MPYKQGSKNINDKEAPYDTIINNNSFFNSNSRNINARTGISFNNQQLESENFENMNEKRK